MSINQKKWAEGISKRNLERLPFKWNFRKFRREFKWNGSSRWNVFGKKVIPFEAFPFSRFDRNARKFLYHLSTICPQLQVPEKIDRFICFSTGTTCFSGKWYGTFPFSFSKYRTCSTIYRNILTENFIQMVSALGQALFFVSPTPHYVPRETKIEPDRRLFLVQNLCIEKRGNCSAYHWKTQLMQ